jgi:hypothetical protein
MSATAPLLDPIAADDRLPGEVLAHLEAQIASTRRLLGATLRQGEAVRRRDVEQVLTLVGEIQAEMDGRARLEVDRARVLHEAAARLGVGPAEVTLDRLALLLAPDAAERARHLSAELRGLLEEVRREHRVNGALMRQELAFLDHLVRLVGQEPAAGYRSGGRPADPAPAAAGHLRALDLRA